jgi:hypothetical protein
MCSQGAGNRSLNFLRIEVGYMSNQYTEHAVQLNINAGYYNALIAALNESKLSGNDTAIGRAEALLSKINNHARLYSDGVTGYADIRFFENEARNLILLLLQAFSHYTPDSTDYYQAAISAE